MLLARLILEIIHAGRVCSQLLCCNRPAVVNGMPACRDNVSTAKAFLQATARGYEYAATHPEEAAKILCNEVAKDTASHPLPTPLDPDMVLQSQHMLSEVRAPPPAARCGPAAHAVHSRLSVVSWRSCCAAMHSSARSMLQQVLKATEQQPETGPLVRACSC